MNKKTSINIHQEKLETILKNAVDTIITINENGIVESANPATEVMFGYSPEELVGQNIKILMPAPDRDRHDGYLKSYLETGLKKIIGLGREVRGLRKDGTSFPVHLAVSEIVVGEQKLFTGVIRDITDVKAVEKKLLQNERLAAIGQMMAGLAHESRNAFQKSHACLTNLAFDVREMPESLELVQKVQGSLDHLNAMLDEVRDYAAPIVLEKAECNLESVVKEIWLQLLQANPESAAIQFNIDRGDGFPDHLKIDRHRMSQVIWNLLENARFASDQEAGQITAELKMENKMATVSICDNGKGIEQDNLDSIFQPFFTTKTKGTGLGLAICQRIVEAHGGSLDASTCNRHGGARFTVQLPVI